MITLQLERAISFQHLSTILTFPDAALPGGAALHHVVQDEMESVIFTEIIIFNQTEGDILSLFLPEGVS